MITQGIKLSPWTVVPDEDSEHCYMRYIEGTDPEDIANRIAFIEKTPRVRFRNFTKDSDWENWCEGYKGGIDYGLNVKSRAWCDECLTKLGYILG